MWIGDVIYFLSDRNGEFNLYSFNTGSQEISQITHFDDFPIISASHNRGKIIFEQSGYLHTIDPGNTSSEKLTVGIATDLLELRSRYVKGDRYIRRAHVSPSGARAVFGFRGDIITVPADKGDPRNLTSTTGVHETNPAWSPDSKKTPMWTTEGIFMIRECTGLKCFQAALTKKQE